MYVQSSFYRVLESCMYALGLCETTQQLHVHVCMNMYMYSVYTCMGKCAVLNKYIIL